MSVERAIRKHPDFLSSDVEQAENGIRGVPDEEVYISSVLVHHHDGSMGQLVWNNVQAIINKNKYLRSGRGVLLTVPDVATEGYNQHHHTSEFDGGIIPGIMGVHDHRDNAHGGFAFACFHPATSVPHAVWE